MHKTNNDNKTVKDKCCTMRLQKLELTDLLQRRIADNIIEFFKKTNTISNFG